MNFSSYFNISVNKLEEIGELPKINWGEWEFLKPKVRDWGEVCTFTVLRTVKRINKETGSDYKSENWCESIIKYLPQIPNAIEIYTENGIINIRLQNTKEKEDSNVNPYNLSPIAFISTCFTEKFGTPRQSNILIRLLY